MSLAEQFQQMEREELQSVRAKLLHALRMRIAGKLATIGISPIVYLHNEQLVTTLLQRYEELF